MWPILREGRRRRVRQSQPRAERPRRPRLLLCFECGSHLHTGILEKEETLRAGGRAGGRRAAGGAGGEPALGPAPGPASLSGLRLLLLRLSPRRVGVPAGAGAAAGPAGAGRARRPRAPDGPRGRVARGCQLLRGSGATHMPHARLRAHRASPQKSRACARAPLNRVPHSAPNSTHHGWPQKH